MEKKNIKNELFDKRYLLGIEEDLSAAPGELEELKMLLEAFDKKQECGGETKKE